MVRVALAVLLALPTFSVFADTGTTSTAPSLTYTLPPRPRVHLDLLFNGLSWSALQATPQDLVQLDGLLVPIIAQACGISPTQVVDVTGNDAAVSMMEGKTAAPWSPPEWVVSPDSVFVSCFLLVDASDSTLIPIRDRLSAPSFRLAVTGAVAGAFPGRDFTSGLSISEIDVSTRPSADTPYHEVVPDGGSGDLAQPPPSKIIGYVVLICILGLIVCLVVVTIKSCQAPSKHYGSLQATDYERGTPHFNNATRAHLTSGYGQGH